MVVFPFGVFLLDDVHSFMALYSLNVLCLSYPGERTYNKQMG
jgi:hypothetical protein